jgi:hypothetical protein
LDTGAAYFEPDELYPVGGFCCQHSHREKYHIRALLEFLGVCNTEARHKPVIRVVAGDLHRVVDAAEKELANRGRHYQAGGLIVSVSTDPASGDPSIVPTSAPALTRELSVAATWEKYDGRAEDWVRCDPPARHAGILFDAQNFRYLSPLAGVARQPYFRESDGELIRQPGYDKTAQRFGVFDARHFVIPDPTPDAARAALSLLEELLTEFHFVAATDKAAALAAIFTGVVRPTLPHAPAFHVRAPVFGSGKTYLCELIGAFAGPGGNAKVSYPKTSEEATKVILSLLLTSPACVEFDDMDTDWIPHGTIKRMLTAEAITDRILGVSKTATVSTRALFLGSGNNVGPIRDLLRRVLTIHLNPRCATPATMTYKGFPVDMVRQCRGVYVSAVLTIIQAWRRAGSLRAQADSIVTFSGAWSDYCRYPLMWLGHPDSGPNSGSAEMLSNEHLVVCGGATAHERGGTARLDLNLHGPSANVRLEIEDISRRLLANISDVHADLLEIASYIYAADSAIPRGGKTDSQLGARWRRKLGFVITATILRHPLDDLRLGHPGIRIAYIKELPEHRRQHAPKAFQCLGVRGPGCPGSDHLANWRQIQAHHTILKKADALPVEQLSRHRAECRKQKRSRPMGRLAAKTAFKMRPNWNVKNAVSTKAAPQLVDQVFLSTYNLSCGTMAYESDLLTVRHHFLDRSGKRIQPSGE